MIYVPAPAQQHPFSHAHYRFIFSQDETGIAFFQLLVNVGFAALLGAILAIILAKLATILAKVPKRALYATAACIAVVVLGVNFVAGSFTNDAFKISERCYQLATCVAFQ